MSNEELAVAIKNGDTEKYSELWQGCKGFVAKQAKLWLTRSNGGNHGLEVDDLVNCGFFAVAAAVEKFSPERGKFLTMLGFCLKREFQRAFWMLSERQKGDPLLSAISLETPVGDGNASIEDMVVDENDGIEAVVKDIYLTQLKAKMAEVLSKLPDDQRQIIEMTYHGKVAKEIAAETGLTLKQIHSKKVCAFGRIRHNKADMAALRELYDFNPYGGVGLQTFKNTGASIEERFVVWADKDKNKNKRS